MEYNCQAWINIRYKYLLCMNLCIIVVLGVKNKETDEKNFNRQEGDDDYENNNRRKF